MGKVKHMRRTRIVATLGPATSTLEMIARLVEAGLDVARLNFSHGDHDSHRRTIGLLRQACKDVGRPVGILQDLAGPKIRLGALATERVLATDDLVRLVSGEEADPPLLPVNYPYLTEDVAVGDRLLLADGLVEMEVTEVSGAEVVCRVLVGGTVSSHKGVNLPVSNLRVPAFTDKDRRDLAVGMEQGVDFVALSFVRHERDLEEVRHILNQVDNPPLLIAKIEKPQAVERLPQILAHVDGVMVARGDLGVEMHLEEVPLIQKRIIRMARREGKPVITATQMLRSMMDSPRPTRAEANDVANAVLDGTDAVMLSDETAVGSYPVEAVRILDRIARATEPALVENGFLDDRLSQWVPATQGSISRAVCHLAADLQASVIVACTTSGSSARMVARFRPPQPVLALTTSQEVQRQLALTWGVVPTLVPHYEDSEQMFQVAQEWVLENKLAKHGQRMVITAGVPMGVPGTTNLIKVIDL